MPETTYSYIQISRCTSDSNVCKQRTPAGVVKSEYARYTLCHATHTFFVLEEFYNMEDSLSHWFWRIYRWYQSFGVVNIFSSLLRVQYCGFSVLNFDASFILEAFRSRTTPFFYFQVCLRFLILYVHDVFLYNMLNKEGLLIPFTPVWIVFVF